METRKTDTEKVKIVMQLENDSRFPQGDSLYFPLIICMCHYRDEVASFSEGLITEVQIHDPS